MTADKLCVRLPVALVWVRHRGTVSAVHVLLVVLFPDGLSTPVALAVLVLEYSAATSLSDARSRNAHFIESAATTFVLPLLLLQASVLSHLPGARTQLEGVH